MVCSVQRKRCQVTIHVMQLTCDHEQSSVEQNILIDEHDRQIDIPRRGKLPRGTLTELKPRQRKPPTRQQSLAEQFFLQILTKNHLLAHRTASSMTDTFRCGPMRS